MASVQVPLYGDKVAIIDEEDLARVNLHNWSAYRGRNTWYAINQTIRKGKRTYLHRHLLDAPDGLQVDHENGDGLDNRRSNIRIATHAQNQANQGIGKNNTSGYKGVVWLKDKKKWRASITIDRRFHFIGHFPTKEEAAMAYNAMAEEIFGEFANLNRVSSQISV